MNKPALLCECGDPDCPGRVPVHWPFGIHVDMISQDPADAEFYLSVRTTSWDFTGERTDLHDIFSLLWAALIRARDVASPRLVTVLNGISGIDSEIYARMLVLDQKGALAEAKPLRACAEALSIESRTAFDALTDAFEGEVDRGSHDQKVSWSPEPDWMPAVRRRFRLAEHKDYEFRLRSFPNWSYFGSNKRGITLADIGESAARKLRQALSTFAPIVTGGVEAMLYRTDRLVNAPPIKALNNLKWLLSQIDGGATESVVVPIDSHLISIGHRSVAAIRTPAGREQFEVARDVLGARRADEAAFLLDDHICVWAEKIDDARFERFVEDLLTVERGVHRVRQVGATGEPDDGRDLIAEWSTPPDRGGNVWREREGTSLSTLREVMVQIKLRHHGVGRSDLPNLRDTLDHYRSDGLLVVAYPRITVPLMEHLSELRRRGQWWVDWWGRTELEARIRRHPEIAARYVDIVQLQSPTQPPGPQWIR